MVHGNLTAHSATLEWRRWDPDKGDPGDPKVLWYNVHIRGPADRAFKMSTIVYHMYCRDKCTHVLKDVSTV